MKAQVLWGLNESMSLETFPDPILNADQVIVEVKAAAFNRRDYWITQGKYPGIVFPIILGSDGAGVFEGEEVIIYPGSNWGSDERFQSNGYTILGMPDHGCFAEKVAVTRDQLFPKPAHLDWNQAAALPLAGLTAYRALFTRAQLKKQEKVLISGAGGGVAMMAMQLAIANGNDVYVTSSKEEKIARAIELGAKGGVNYKDENWSKTLKSTAGEFDIIIDSAAGSGFGSLVKLLGYGGRIAFYGGTAGNIEQINPFHVFWKQISILGSTMGSPKEFQDMLDFVELNNVIPIVDKVYSLEEANEAMGRLKGNQQFGKIILNVA